VSVPNLVPSSPQAFAPGFLRTLDESTIRSEILHPRAATELVHCVEQDETEDCANARDGLSEVKGMGLVLLRRCEAKECEVAEHRIIRGEQSEVDRNGLVDRRVVKPLGDAFPLGLRSDLLANVWPVIWRMGIVDMRQECRAFSPQVWAASQHIAGSAHLGRIDRGFWQQAAASQGGHLVRVDLVIFGLAAVHGFHRARLSQDKGHLFLSAEGGEPIPGEDTCNGHDKAVAVGSNGLEERCRSGFPMAVYKPRALLTQDTDVQASGMSIDTTGKWMLVGVEAHEVSSFLGNLHFPLPAYHRGRLRGRPQSLSRACKRRLPALYLYGGTCENS